MDYYNDPANGLGDWDEYKTRSSSILSSYYPGYGAVHVKEEKKEIDPIDVIIQREFVEYRTGYDGTTEELLKDPSFKKQKTMILTGNGMWAFVQNSCFKLVNLYAPISFQAHYTNLTPTYQLLIPKLPGYILAQILAVFRYHTISNKLEKTTEAMSQVYWDSNKQEYFINIPDQVVTGGHVDYNYNLNSPRCFENGVFKVFDIHSHNTMGSFFSSVDDKDETVSDHFFGVIGNIKEDSHTSRWRFGINGHFVEVPVDEIVDLSTFSENVEFPQEWLERIHFPEPVQYIQPVLDVKSWTPYDRTRGVSAGHYWWKDREKEEDVSPHYYLNRFVPSGLPPYNGSDEEWIKYLEQNLAFVVSKPRQIIKIIESLIGKCTDKHGLVHRLKTVVGQHEAKLRRG
jgi:PRTRC genetic system protein A